MIRKLNIILVTIIILLSYTAQVQSEMTIGVKVGDKKTYRIDHYYNKGKNEEQKIYFWEDGTHGNVTIKAGLTIAVEVCETNITYLAIGVTKTINGMKTPCEGDPYVNVMHNASYYENLIDRYPTTYTVKGNTLIVTQNYTHNEDNVFNTLVNYTRDINTGWLLTYTAKQINETGGLLYLYEYSIYTGNNSIPGYSYLSMVPLVILTVMYLIRRKNKV